MEFSTILGAWVAAGLTLFIFSFLYKDNPFFKAAEHLYIGAGLAWHIQLIIYKIIKVKVWEPMKVAWASGNWFTIWMIIIPTILGLSLITQFIPRISWLSRYGFTFMMGYSAGLALPAGLATDFTNQILGTIEPFANIVNLTPGQLINALILLIGSISVLFYFFFSIEHKGAVKKISNFGIYFLMIYFGASFGNTVMARFSLLYGRFDLLVRYSNAQYFYATNWIIVGLVIYFLLEKFVLNKVIAKNS
ncbi:MAG: hypothetical protein ACP5SD_02835 [Elusimicrobiales bacterium]|nr:hypothetical protein [Elusimicrobiales bacterium]HOL62418.1 hypothetical protein [Elusimicrobiales bacterium]HPO94390.1 hypothetical protein [Elusimicrobiales bacterium]